MASVEDEELDPRVQVELEKLNTATDDINKLEAKLEEANYVFRTTLTESTARLKTLAKKLGSCIEKARPFYEAQEIARSTQLDCQRAAVQYQRANALHQAAKETIALAEERFVNSRHERWQFDSAWQEMLNHATMKVMEAEAQKAASEREHMRRAAAFTQAEQRVQQLQRGLRSSINKSLVYFEEKSNITSQLEGQKERVQQLQRAIAVSKSSYAQSLRSLELISEEIHEQRRCRMPREPGVGAELTPPEVSDAQPYSGNTAKSFTPLEEMTAKDEKYWETLRLKLETLHLKNQTSSSTEEEMFSDLESPDGRERTVTGSSCASHPEEERIIVGENSPTETGDGTQSPSGMTVLDLNKHSLEKTDGETSREGSLDLKEVEIDVDRDITGPLSDMKVDIDNGNCCDDSAIGYLVSKEETISAEIESASIGMKVNVEENTVNLSNREMGSAENGNILLNKENDSLENDCGVLIEDVDDSENKSSENNSLKDAAISKTAYRTKEMDNVSSDVNRNEGIASNVNGQECDIEFLDMDNSNPCEVKERGDGSSSPPPAMCQPSRHLSAIPE